MATAFAPKTWSGGLGSRTIFSDPLLTNPIFYAVAIPAVVIMGLAKGGFTGLSMLSVPMMTLVMPPVQAAAVTLPILIAQDVVSVWVFRGLWDKKLVAILISGGVVGVALGYALAASVSSAAVELALGIVSIVFAAQRLWVERAALIAPVNAPAPVGVLFGIVAGFTSQIAHAGAPPFQLWVLPRRLRRDVLVGTSAVFFAVINWIKVPAFAALGQFSATNVLTAAALLPVAIVSTFAGVWLVRRIDGERFYKIIYWLMILVGVILLFEAAL